MGRTGSVSRKLHRIWESTVETATDRGYGTYIVWVEPALFHGTPITFVSRKLHRL